MRNTRRYTSHVLLRAAVSFLILRLGSSFAAAQIPAFPQAYAPAPAKGAAYGALLRAKILWLNAKITHERGLLAAARHGLTSRDAHARADAEAKIDGYRKAIGDDGAELVILGGPVNAAQRALVKKNVQGWIDALAAEVRKYETFAGSAARAAEKANTKTEARWRRREEQDSNRAADAGRKEESALKKDMEDAGL